MSQTSKKKTIVLHVGRHKTGTTSIQRTCKANHLNLKKRGVLYPKTLPGCHSAFLIDAFGDPDKDPIFARLGRTPKQIREQTKERLSNIRREIRHFDGEKIVFSGENAGTGLTVPHLEKLKATMHNLCGEEPAYKVLYFTRDPLGRAESGIQQLIKANGMTEEDARSFQLQGGGKRYQKIYETYAEAFGDDAVQFYSYEVARSHPEGLISYFMNTIGVSSEGLKDTSKQTNTSISGEVLKFLSWLYEGPRLSPQGGARMQFRTPRAPISDTDRLALFDLKGEKASFLSEADSQQIWDSVTEDMAFLKARFGISYEPPKDCMPPEGNLFSSQFLENLETVLPTLNDALRAEFVRFIETETHLAPVTVNPK
ncbi:MAG: hypothetical protein JXR15_03875 [Shimia sp.]|uniref:hypothetical protein n=1 Tax=Shimia sp. TaxID=1954381 RepID=UPI003B8CA120